MSSPRKSESSIPTALDLGAGFFHHRHHLSLWTCMKRVLTSMYCFPSLLVSDHSGHLDKVPLESLSTRSLSFPKPRTGSNVDSLDAPIALRRSD